VGRDLKILVSAVQSPVPAHQKFSYFEGGIYGRVVAIVTVLSPSALTAASARGRLDLAICSA
jgi:hypothetical protein